MLTPNHNNVSISVIINLFQSHPNGEIRNQRQRPQHEAKKVINTIKLSNRSEVN